MGPQFITVHLMPKVNYAPRLRRIIGKLLAEINAQQPRVPDGTDRPLRFRLGRRSELRLSLEIETTESSD